MGEVKEVSPGNIYVHIFLRKVMQGWQMRWWYLVMVIFGDCDQPTDKEGFWAYKFYTVEPLLTDTPIKRTTI